MKTQLLPNESIVFEKAANLIKTVTSTGGELIITNQRMLFESSILGKNVKLEIELPLNNITGYKLAFTTGVVLGVIAVPNAVAIITKAETYKFTVFDRDILFSHFKKLIPDAEHLPDEKYTESMKHMGGKIISKVTGKKSNEQQAQPSSYDTPVQPVSNESEITCPKCGGQNLKTAKFCNGCGEKLQTECPNCHAPIEEGKKFCGECGTPIKQKDECPKCGAKIVSGQKFCNECGERTVE